MSGKYPEYFSETSQICPGTVSEIIEKLLKRQKTISENILEMYGNVCGHSPDCSADVFETEMEPPYDFTLHAFENA